MSPLVLVVDDERKIRELVRSYLERAGIDLDTPLLRVSLKLKCTKCGQRKSYCRPEPYGISQRKAW